MPSRPDELEALKTEVNLIEVAASLGYEFNRRRSSKSSVVMDHAGGDRIIVAVAPDGHWIYCSIRDTRDSGSVIDFWQRRRGGNLGEVRKALRPFLGGPTPPLPPGSPRPFPTPTPVERDIIAVRARYEAMVPVEGYHPYLVEARKLPPRLFEEVPFAGRVRADDRGNAVFPHFNGDGLCGYEIKNAGFTGFARGGVKGLWASAPGPQDDTLVIAETAIDALSHAAIKGTRQRRFVSTAGQMNNDQPALLRAAMLKLPKDGRVVLALDNDAGGDELGARITDIYSEAGRIDLSLIEDRPSQRGADWNDALKDAASPTPRPEPG